MKPSVGNGRRNQEARIPIGPGWQEEVSEQGRVVGQMYDKLPREEQQQILFMLLQAKARALAHDDPTSERNLL